MRHSNQKRREEAAAQYAEAAKLANENGMDLRPLAYADNPEDVTQYRIEGPEGAWYKEIYPGNQRIYCPDKSKQGPFVSMPFGKRWNLIDVVRACIAAVAKAAKNPMKRGLEISGEASDTRQFLCELIRAISKFECTGEQEALRDMMTDLRHTVDHLKLDFALASDGSYEVYLEEKGEADYKFEEGPA